MATSIQVYADPTEVTEMAKRFRAGVKGGDKLSVTELQSLAETAIITKLNPYIGEIWGIPGKGTMIGIAGARRLWNEQSKAGGGFSFIELIPCTPSDAGATEADVVIAFKAIAHDSKATTEYQKVFLETLNSLRAAGSDNPVHEAREIVGPKPQWIGYGYSTKSEQSRMNKTQLARKRAEADALKKCVIIPFGVDIAAQDNAKDIDSEVIDAQEVTAQPVVTHTNAPTPIKPQATAQTERPYAPAVLKAKIEAKAQELTGTVLRGNEAQVIAMNLDEIFMGDKTKRHAVMHYLTGHESATDISDGMKLAVKRWINPTQDTGGAWHMDKLAEKEAHEVYRQAMLDQGQMELIAN